MNKLNIKKVRRIEIQIKRLFPQYRLQNGSYLAEILRCVSE